MWTTFVKMAGPKGNLSKGWSLIREKVKMQDPTPVGKYLGSDHIVKDVTAHAGCNPFAGDVVTRGDPDKMKLNRKDLPTQPVVVSR